MPLTLTSGNESRTAGAPFIPLDRREEYIRLRARELMIQNELLDEHTALRQAQAEVAEGAAARQAMEARLAQGAADRQRQQAQRRGVEPESLPADEYGAVSARTVRTANMSPEGQEAEQAQYQGLVDAEIRDLREGRFHGAAAQARQYEQDYGLPTTPSSTGKTDLDYLREIQQQQGFIRTGSGEMIPIGPAPTPESLASRRDFDEWANETPGTERQALYDPEGYEEFREGVRQDIRDRARQEMETYGGADPSKWTDEQKARRDERAASEDRVNNSDWQQRRRQERLAARAGLPPDAAAMQIDFANAARNAGMRPEERLEESLRVRGNLGRLAAQQARRDLVAQRGALRGAGLSPAVGDMRNRFDDLIDRLGQEGMNDWQRAGIIAGLAPNAQTANPTPLSVDAMGAQNAMRFINNEAIAGMDPMRRALAEQQADLALRGQAPEIAGQNDIAAGNWETPEARSVLDGVAERHDTTIGGMSYEDEARLAQTLQAPPYNMSQPDAEAKAYELAEKRRRIRGQRPEERGRPLPPGPAASAPAAPQRPYAGGRVPSQPPVTGRKPPPPGAQHQWHGGRGGQLPPGAGRGGRR